MAIHLDRLRLDREADGKVVPRAVSEAKIAREDLLRGRTVLGLVRIGRSSGSAREAAHGGDDTGGGLDRERHLPVARDIGRSIAVADAAIDGELVALLCRELAEVRPDVRLAELLIVTRDKV